MKENQPLGRGLASLIPSDFQSEAKSSATQIKVSLISPNPYQPRIDHKEDEALRQLADSIKVHGILQPLIVTKDGDRYQLVAGQRRLDAAKIAGLGTVPVIVREAAEQEKLEMAIIENIQRSDLNPLEEASAYKRLIDEFGLKQDAVASKVGKDRSTVANVMRLLELPDEIKDALRSGKITSGHARAILGLEDKDKQLALFRKITNTKMTVRDVEDAVRAESGKTQGGGEKDAETKAAEAKLRDFFQTKVNLQKNKEGKGRITIEFYSAEELDQILNKLED